MEIHVEKARFCESRRTPAKESEAFSDLVSCFEHSKGVCLALFLEILGTGNPGDGLDRYAAK